LDWTLTRAANEGNAMTPFARPRGNGTAPTALAADELGSSASATAASAS